MASNTFDTACAETQIQACNLSLAAVQDCMGDSDADEDHFLLKVNTSLLNSLTLKLAVTDITFVCPIG